jgi:Domain of unknown function (DUF5668)
MGTEERNEGRNNGMRTWRVGTFSMGAALLFLGVFLLLSRMLDMDFGYAMMSWWPIILVILGAEILLFLLFSKQEKPYLKYDFLSILFVGILGTAGIGFAAVSSTGILDKLDDVVNREERTMDLPEFTEKLDGSIKRIIVQTGNSPITIEGASGKDVSMFGTYRAMTAKKENLVSKPSDYVSSHRNGDSLYITVKELPNETAGPFERYASMDATLLIPKGVKLEVTGTDNTVTMKPRQLMSDWSVEQVSHVSLYIQEESSLMVNAFDIKDLQGSEGDWKVTKEAKPSGEEGYADSGSGGKDATYQSGSGEHRISISNSYSVSLNTAAE